MSDTCSLFPPFGDPWLSCLLPSQYAYFKYHPLCVLFMIGKLWYIYTMENYSAIKKNSFESVLMRWMKLEPIIQSEVSQKDKEHYSILTHMYRI